VTAHVEDAFAMV